MDAIRAAMGVPTIDYLGFSYGTYIGALYADRYPDRVRAMVLDGAIDPAASYDDATVRQAVGFERSARRVLRVVPRRQRRASSRAAANPRTAFDDLMTSIAGETDPGTVDGEHRTLGIGEANIGVATALYSGKGDDGWGALGTALERRGARRRLGPARALRRVHGPPAPAARTTTRPPRSTRSAASTVRRRRRSPRCSGSPARAARVVAALRRVDGVARAAVHVLAGAAPVGRPAPIHAAGAPPIVVIGNTDDPATPYAQAQALARELQSGHLLTYVGEGHTAYGRDDCIDDAVDSYLISLDAPEAAATRCR